MFEEKLQMSTHQLIKNQLMTITHSKLRLKIPTTHMYQWVLSLFTHNHLLTPLSLFFPFIKDTIVFCVHFHHTITVDTPPYQAPFINSNGSTSYKEEEDVAEDGVKKRIIEPKIV
jgi:hypothetical protein